MVGNNFTSVQIFFLTFNYLIVCLLVENLIDRFCWAFFLVFIFMRNSVPTCT